MITNSSRLCRVLWPNCQAIPRNHSHLAAVLFPFPPSAPGVEFPHPIFPISVASFPRRSSVLILEASKACTCYPLVGLQPHLADRYLFLCKCKYFNFEQRLGILSLSSVWMVVTVCSARQIFQPRSVKCHSNNELATQHSS